MSAAKHEGTVAEVLAGEARFAVVCGERDEVLATMGDAAVDVTLTDPPYNERTHAGMVTNRSAYGVDAATVAPGFAAMGSLSWWPEALRASRRWCLAFCAAEQVGDYERAAPSAWVRAGVWVRTNATPQFTGDRPATGAEAVAIAHRDGRKRWNGGGKAAVWMHDLAGDETGSTRVHPTQKPIRLMRELVRLFSDPGEVVFDPHAGSGTTGVAALLEGRRVILVERDPAHAATCLRRLRETEPRDGTRPAKQLKLFGAR